MPAPIVEVEGGARFRATLKAAGDDLGDLSALHGTVAAMVSARAAQLSPHVSGRLAASGRPGKGKTAALVRFGTASVPYAGPIHYGWPSRNIRPQPFVSEAALATQPTWMDTYTAGIDRILEKVKGV